MRSGAQASLLLLRFSPRRFVRQIGPSERHRQPGAVETALRRQRIERRPASVKYQRGKNYRCLGRLVRVPLELAARTEFGGSADSP